MARLLSVIVSPPGFFLDEAAGAAHAISLLHSGTNAHDVVLPLYSESLGGGYTTPIYVYPLVSWIAIFGTSELAFRYFSVICGLLAIALLSFSINTWFSKRDALIAAVVALALPWGWLQSNLAWDPALVPLFISGAFAAFTVILHSSSRAMRTVMLVLFPAFLLCLAYLYPPARVTAPLLFIGGYLYFWRRGIISIRSLFVTCVASAIVAIPLLEFMIQPEALGRSSALSVFHDTSFIHGIGLLTSNIAQLLNPLFLFFDGDPNLRHATGFQGMLGIAAIPAVIALIVAGFHTLRRSKPFYVIDHRKKLLIKIAVYGIMAAFLGSALTNEGQPHSLRACAAWPFIVMLLVIGWRIVIDAPITKIVKWTALTVAIVATCAYCIDLTAFYPSRSASSFDVSERQMINNDQPTPSYPDLARRYYQIR
ncbi:hypothetical protein EON76_00385 [bacterium]|nr:MAG: hypothetical protein EON76_00385 [bacterium]